MQDKQTQTKSSNNFNNLIEKLEINSFVLYYKKDEVFYDETNKKIDANILNDMEDSLTIINKNYKSHTISTIGDGETIEVVVFTE